MAKGKRLDNNKRAKQSNASQTGRLWRIPDNAHSESNIAVGDKGNPTINFYYIPPNSKVELNSEDHWDRTVPTTPGKSVRFSWFWCTLTFVMLSLIGALRYDHIAPPAKAMGGLLLSVVGALLTMAQWFGWTPGKLGNILGAIGVGILLAVVLLAGVCEYGGWRLNIVSTKGAPEQSEIMTGQPSEEDGNAEDDVENTPTIEPSPSLPSIDVDGDIVEPIIVTPQPSNTDVVLQNVQADYFELICFGNRDQDYTSFTAGEIEKWKAEFLHATKELMGARKTSDVSSVDQGRFERLTMDANTLEQQLSEQLDQIVALQAIIDLRESAYKIKPTQSLCNMLSNSYISLAKEYQKEDDYENAYQSYYAASKWELAYIQGLDQIDNNYYQRLYNMATSYQGIGSLEGLSDKDRIDANYISLCLFETVSQNLTSGGNKQYLSCVYAGMVSHKLLNLDTKATPEDSVRYFEEAYAYYTKALETPSKDEKSTYRYLNQICTWAEQYSRTKKGKPLLQDAKVYAELAAAYKRMSL